MAVTFNPFTGNFDFTGSGGSTTASGTTFTPYDQLVSTDVQSALQELDLMANFDPTSTGWKRPIFDEYLFGANGAEPYGEMGWDFLSNGGGGGSNPLAPTTSEKNRIGIVNHVCGTGVGNIGGMRANQNIMFGQSTIVLAWSARIPTLADATDDYYIRWGFSNTWPTVQHGAMFEYDRSTSANWRILTAAASVQTTTTTTTAVDTNWHNFRMVITNSSSVAFYIDGVLLGTHTTNIPSTTVCGPTLIMNKTAGTLNRSWYIDWSYMRYTLGATRGTF